MLVVQDFANLPNSLEATSQSSITIGNFDGFHRGHQSLWETVSKGQERLGGPAIAITFEPHPRSFFEKKDQEPGIFSLNQKQRAFEEAGCQLLVIQNFDRSFAEVSREAFVDEFLLNRGRAKLVVVGQDFRFGKDRKGDIPFLQSQCQLNDVEAVVPPDILHHEERISSSRIRKCLLAGSLEDAIAMLGKPYLIEGTIVKGDQLGRTLNFPTANLSLAAPQIIPKPGVYLVDSWFGESERKPRIWAHPDQLKPAVLNIGFRPTLARTDPQLQIEAHVLDQDLGDDLYGMAAGFYLRRRLRDERKFGSKEELAQQIAKDIDRARSYLRA